MTNNGKATRTVPNRCTAINQDGTRCKRSATSISLDSRCTFHTRATVDAGPTAPRTPEADCRSLAGAHDVTVSTVVEQGQNAPRTVILLDAPAGETFLFGETRLRCMSWKDALARLVAEGLRECRRPDPEAEPEADTITATDAVRVVAHYAEATESDDRGPVYAALAVIVLTPRVREAVGSVDPKAFRQALKALYEAACESFDRKPATIIFG